MRVFVSQRRKPLIGLLLAFAMVLSLLPAMTGTASAAQILPEEVAVAQSQSGTCTLASAAMMIRGRMYLSGNSKWSSITEHDIRGDVWLEGAGIYYSWTYTTVGVIITGDHEDVSGLSESQLSAMLSRHPEGIEIHCAGVPHAVLVTDYTEGVFYCFDPAQYYSGRRIPLTGSWLGECLGSQSSILASITSYWYISSYSIQPDTTVPTAQPVVQTPEPVVEPTGAPTVEPTSAPALPALTVVRQPENQYGKAGDQIAFTAAAAGGENLTYQWQYSRDGEKWQRSSAAGTTANCLLNQTTDGTWYRCMLLIQEAPVITQQPEDVVGAKNSKGRFTIAAVGSGLKYQWQYSDNEGGKWTNSKSTSDYADCTLSAKRNGRLYRCIVTDAAGMQTISQTARINISDSSLRITRQPEDIFTKDGANVMFTLNAEGEGLKYQWQNSSDGGKTWKNFEEPGAHFLVFAASESQNGWLYRCIVTDENGGRVISATAKLVISSLKFTAVPESVTVSRLSVVRFRAAAAGENVRYQWQYSSNGKAWFNASTGQTLTWIATPAANGRLVRCVVTDDIGNYIISAPARLTVH